MVLDAARSHVRQRLAKVSLRIGTSLLAAIVVTPFSCSEVLG